MNLSEAEAHAQLGLPVPKGTPYRSLKLLISKLSWFFLHHQVAFNTDVLGALDTEVLGAAGLLARIEAQEASLNAQSVVLDTLGRDVWAAISAQTNQIDAQGGDLWSAIAAQTAAHAQELENLNRDLWSALSAQTKLLDEWSKDLWSALKDLWSALSAQTNQLDERSREMWSAITNQTDQADTVGRDLWESLGKVWTAVADAREVLEEGQAALQIHVDLMQRQAFARHHEGIGALRSELVEMSLQFGEIQEMIDGAAAVVGRQFDEVRKEIETAAADTRRRQGTVDLLLNEVRRSLPEPISTEALENLPSPLDALYADFEETFRGSASSVAQRVQGYLPDILSLHRLGPVVDLGSGRGEWLELLKDAGVDAYGVDLSRDFVALCQGRGLKVLLGDALEHLRGLPERSLAAVTAFHFVEHLSVDRVVEMLDLAVRALQPGGVLILETPNPENLTVGASSFYLDPSHVRPLPPDLLAFLVEARGLAEVETRFLHPSTDNELRAPTAGAAWSADVAPLVNAVSARLYGPLDYAIIGRRL